MVVGNKLGEDCCSRSSGHDSMPHEPINSRVLSALVTTSLTTALIRIILIFCVFFMWRSPDLLTHHDEQLAIYVGFDIESLSAHMYCLFTVAGAGASVLMPYLYAMRTVRLVVKYLFVIP